MYAHPEEEDHHRASALLQLPEVEAYHPVAAAALAVEVVVVVALADPPTVVQMCTVVVHYTLVVAVVVGLTFVAEAWVDLAFLSVEAFHQVADPAFDEEQEEVGHDSSGVVDPDSF
jgi:hypothetical protein